MHVLYVTWETIPASSTPPEAADRNIPRHCFVCRPGQPEHGWRIKWDCFEVQISWTSLRSMTTGPSCISHQQGRTHGGGARGLGSPWDLKNTIFSGFLPLTYVICILEVCFFSVLLYGRTEEACSMVKSLRKVDFSHPTGHYTWKKFRPPLRNSWVRPCLSGRNTKRHWSLENSSWSDPVRARRASWRTDFRNPRTIQK